MRKRDFKQLLHKYSRGKLNEIDTHLVDTWYDSFGYGENVKPLLDKANADKLHSQLRDVLEQHVAKQVKIRRLNFWPYAAAASLLFGVLFSFLYYRSLQTPGMRLAFDTIKTQKGELKKVKLPDSSEVWMNAGSVIRYASATFNRHRTIYLDEGEAFFQVTKDPEHPFEVHTPKLYTRVLGTSFNVKAYQELHYTSVMVKTGRVQVNVKKTRQGPVITASQGLVCDQLTGALQRNDLPAEESGSWVSGVTILHEATFKELALVFYNRYGLKMSSTNPGVLKYHYTINLLQNKSVDGALKLICSIHNNQYRRNSNEIIIY